MKSIELLKSEHINSETLRIHTAQYLKKNSASVVTVRGVPRQVVVPYQAMVEIIERLEKTK